LKHSDQLISANLIARQDGELLVKPYVIKQVPVSGAAKKLRVGFLGLSAQKDETEMPDASYRWADPLLSAAKFLPELREQCDLLVVLACMPSWKAEQLAMSNNTIDLILNGYKYQPLLPLSRANQAQIVHAEDEGKSLGELRFTVKGNEMIRRVSIDHFLTSDIPDDPALADFVAKAKAKIKATQE
jgi:2',3'-cyclic-nucleotide 2'-phosphodiesterase (5'-nucleotidase family)